MLKQIICTILILVGISVYTLCKNEEELTGNIVKNKQYSAEEKSKTLNMFKWIFNKEYRRGYLWGVK